MKKKNLNIIFTVVAVASVSLFLVNSISNVTKNVYASNATDLPITYVENTSQEAFDGRVENGVQVIEFDLQPNSYPNLTVKKGMPVKLIINVDENSLNSCNYVMVSSEMNFQKQLDYGQNVIEFTPSETGNFIYSCWMGMVGANISVVEQDIVPTAVYGANVSNGGCCSVR